jgi:hypothetical protein
VSYDAALIQTKDTNGRYHFGTVDVHADLLEDFGERLLGHLNHYPDLQDAFFVHELRGAKSASLHEIHDDDAVQDALDGQLAYLDADMIDAQEWYIDVALEIRDPNCVVQWLTVAHHQILQFVLPSANDNQIVKLLKSSKFNLDRSAQLRDCAGFRLDPGRRGQADGVVYINVYTTDKSPTYQLHTGVFRRRTAEDLFPTRISRLVEDIEKMRNIFMECGTLGQEGTARLEIRIPLSRAQRVLRELGEEFIQQTTISYPNPLWW